MTIGIISDTHDNVVNVKKAADKFKEAKVEFVLHCGDIICPLTIGAAPAAWNPIILGIESITPADLYSL